MIENRAIQIGSARQTKVKLKVLKHANADLVCVAATSMFKGDKAEAVYRHFV